MKEYIVIDTTVGMRQYASEDLLYVSSDGNYSDFVLTSGEKFNEIMQLGQVVKLLEEQLPLTGSNFARIGRKHIINMTYLVSIDLPRRKLKLLDRNLKAVELTVMATLESLSSLKETMLKKNKFNYNQNNNE